MTVGQLARPRPAVRPWRRGDAGYDDGGRDPQSIPDAQRRPDVDLLLERHAIMPEARPEAMPGRFRVRANQAGFNLFAAPDLVEATLRTGFAAGRGLSTRSLARSS